MGSALIKYELGEELPKFCWKCGSYLQPLNLFVGFNSYTREEVYHDFLVCPKVNLLLGNGHAVWQKGYDEEDNIDYKFIQDSTGQSSLA
jgi:hypothetical protein